MSLGVARKDDHGVSRNSDLIRMVEKLAPTSDYLCLATFMAFAAPLMEIINLDEGAVFYFAGESSSGKSTLLNLIQAFVDPLGNRELQTFELTPTAIEEAAFKSNDGILYLDEAVLSGEANPESSMRRHVYKLANGSGKKRASATSIQQAYPNLSWRTIVALTGEPKLFMSSRQSSSSKSGVDARFFQIEVPDNAVGGIMNFAGQTTERYDHKSYRELVLAIKSYGGVEYQEWLTYLVGKKAWLSTKSKEIMEDYVRKLIGKNATAFDQRRARKLVLLALTGVLLRAAGLFKWEAKFPFYVIDRIFRDLANKGFHKNVGTSLSAEFAKNLMARVTNGDISDDEPSYRSASTKLGYFECVTNMREWLLIPKQKLGAAFNVANADEVVTAFKEVPNLLKLASDKKSYTQRRVLIAGELQSERYLKIHWPTLRKVAFPDNETR